MEGSTTSILDSLTPVAPAVVAAPPSKSGGSATSILDSLQPVAPMQAQSGGSLQQPYKPTYGGIAQNAAAGANRTIFGALGAPVDLVTGAINLGARAVGAPEIKNPVGGSEWINKQWAGLTGVNPQEVQPQTEAERIAAATGGAVAQVPIMAMGGAGAARALPSSMPVARGVAEKVAESATPQIAASTPGQIGNTIAVTAPIAVGAGIGQAAEDVAPEPLKPYANLAGNLAGGVGMQALQTAGRKAIQSGIAAGGRAGIGFKQDVGGVNATESQIQSAGRQVANAVGPEGAANLSAETPDVLVPGSQPTTAQVAMTPGAVALEKAHRVADQTPWIQRAEQQNTARLAQVQGLAPAEAQPGAVGAFFRQQLDDLDQAGQQATQAARVGVQQATESLGGAQPTQAYGDQARAALQAAREPVHAETQALWRAVDPDGTWALQANPTREAAGNLIKEISPTAQTDAQETALLQRAVRLPDVVSFQGLGQMRADINAAMRRLVATPGMEPNVRRLTILKQSVDQSIEDALNGRSAQEAQAVAAGRMTPEQTLQRQVQDWYAARNAAAAADTNGGGAVGRATGGGSTAVPGMGGTEGEAGGGLGNAPRAAGLPGQAQPLEPNLTPEHADAYRAAVNATREEKQRFGQGGVGQVLRPGRNGEEFSVQSGAVPGKIFTRGPTEPGEVERFITAVGGPERASQIGRETLANELRQTGIIKPDGTLDPARFASWQARRQATIQQFPGLGDQFANAQRAQETLDSVTADHLKAVKDFQASAAAKFINNDPSTAVRQAFASDNPEATFTQLVRQVRGNKDAEEGLKRAVVDFLTEKTRSATPANATEDFQKAATFRNFIRQHNGALKALFGGQGVQNLDMVAADLRRQAQQTSATAGSDTAANIAAAKKTGLVAAAKHSSPTIMALVGEHLGEHLHGGLLGAGVGIVAVPYLSHMVSAFRQAGIDNINALVREAMLHPDLARELITKTNQLGPVSAQRISRALQAIVTANLTRPSEEKKQ